MFHFDMATRLITCPETVHLEQIEYEDHPFGLVITACTRFKPACAVACPRTCAARFDRRRMTASDFLLDEDEEVTQIDVTQVDAFDELRI